MLIFLKGIPTRGVYLDSGAFLEKASKKFKLDKPIVVVGAGLLSNENIEAIGYRKRI